MKIHSLLTPIIIALFVFSCTEEIKQPETPESMISLANAYFKSNLITATIQELDSIAIKFPDFVDSVKYKELKYKIDSLHQSLTQRKIENEKTVKYLTRKMRIKEDDMKGIKWYYDKTSAKYSNRNSFHLYFGQEKGFNPNLRLKIQYTADDWLFIDNYIVKCDDERYDLIPLSTAERDNGNGRIWEWHDLSVNSEIRSIVEAVIDSKSTKIRSNGSQYYKDRTITSREKKALKNVLELCDALKDKYIIKSAIERYEY